MAPRLTEGSKAVKLLRQKIRNGEIKDNTTAQSVWESDKVFRPHGVNALRNKIRKLQDEMREELNTEDKPPTQLLNRRFTAEPVTLHKKPRLEEDEFDLIEQSDDDFDTDFSAPPAIKDDRTFKPLYLLSIWKEPGTTTRRISAAIVLPSGIEPGRFALRVVDGGLFLEMTVMWPPPLVQLEMMHRKWLNPTSEERFELYHPKVVGFETALKRLRNRTSDMVESVARIPLAFPVQTHIEQKFNLGWKESSTLMVYVDMKAVVEGYAVVNDRQAFEVL